MKSGPKQDFEAVLRRQDHLIKHAPECPYCFSHQVQIMEKAAPARWRCRICWKRFVFEPPEDDHVVPVVFRSGRLAD